MSSQSQLLIPLHVSYIKNLGEARTVIPSSIEFLILTNLSIPQSKDYLAYHLTAHLRMNAVYWGLTALCVMGHKDALDRDETVEFVMSCWDDEAGLSMLVYRCRGVLTV